MCSTAIDACVQNYKATLTKDSSDFASDVQQILAEQTETVAEREKGCGIKGRGNGSERAGNACS